MAGRAAFLARVARASKECFAGHAAFSSHTGAAARVHTSAVSHNYATALNFPIRGDGARMMSSTSGERSSRLSKFHTLDIASRLDKLETAGFVTPEQKAALQGEGLSIESASSMVENVVAVFGMPMGVSLNMTVNGEDVVVPMVIEEPSVVAAVGNVARMTRPEGFTASSDDPIMIGQMHVRNVADPRAAKAALEAKFEEFTEMVHAIQPNLLKRGGGVRGWEAKVLVYDEPGEEREESVVLNFFMDCRDAMGANMINTTAEKLAPEVERVSGGSVGLKILSNLADKRLARCSVAVPFARLATAAMSGEEVAQGIAAAYRFAYADPHRACTHNKGVMNGIDPVILATGNDWRAIEAGAHAYAARDGQYRPLASWKVCAADRTLRGHIELPMQVGIVGGTIRSHPTAGAALGIMSVRSAQHLGEIIAAVGLAQNLAALRALATEGIQRGHMSMHARSLVARVLADRPEELRGRVYTALLASGNIKENEVRRILADMGE